MASDCYWGNGVVQLYQTDARSIPLPNQSVHCVVTSPPYFGLRVYKDNDDRGIGLEASVEAYIANLVDVFREVWRVLRDDGCCWVNLGDSYAGSPSGSFDSGNRGQGMEGGEFRSNKAFNTATASGLSQGNRLGIPERVILALQADGWIWRDTIIWAKKSAMPESLAGWRWERCRRQAPGIDAVIIKAREQVGIKQSELDKSFLLTASGLPGGRVSQWETGIRIPTPEQWAKLKELLPIGDQHDDLIADWHDRVGNSRLDKSDSRVRPGAFSPETLAPPRPCPGCPKCSANDGLVLRKGSWRTTSSHEYIYMLTKGMGYYADGEAVKTAAIHTGRVVKATGNGAKNSGHINNTADGFTHHDTLVGTGANRRSVWNDISPEPYGGSHFATFPSDLPRICIQASTSEAGCCSECGAQWARVVSSPTGGSTGQSWHNHQDDAESGNNKGSHGEGDFKTYEPAQTLGWRPTCRCGAKAVPALVLDPFAGTATTCLAAQRLGRRAVGTDISEAYLQQAVKRLEAVSLPLGT